VWLIPLLLLVAVMARAPRIPSRRSLPGLPPPSSSPGEVWDAERARGEGKRWTLSGPERLLNSMVAWLDELPVSVVVTDGVRTPADQASAMLAKLKRYGAASLSIYQDEALVDELLSGPDTEERWAAIIAKAAQSGRYLSRHIIRNSTAWRGALDIRSRDDGDGDILAALRATGAHVVVEEDHYHVEL
jgi:hypothetical protein